MSLTPQSETASYTSSNVAVQIAMIIDYGLLFVLFLGILYVLHNFVMKSYTPLPWMNMIIAAAISIVVWEYVLQKPVMKEIY